MSVNIFNEEANEEKAENARLSSFVGALTLGDVVKSTLGPKGVNKIMQSVSSGDINVTSDGATILKAIQLCSNPMPQLSHSACHLASQGL